MLDKAFMRRFFDQIETLQEVDLVEKADQITKIQLALPKGCEARLDANFMLRHLRKELLERQFKPSHAVD
jgi:hypothetical protein